MVLRKSDTMLQFMEQQISCFRERYEFKNNLISMILGDTFEDRRKRNAFGRSGSVSRFAIQKDGFVEISFLNSQVI